MGAPLRFPGLAADERRRLEESCAEALVALGYPAGDPVPGGEMAAGFSAS